MNEARTPGRPSPRYPPEAAARCPCPGCSAGRRCVVAIDRVEAVLESASQNALSASAVMARGVDLIASAVTARGVGWCPVGPHGDDAPGSLVSVSEPLPADPEEARLDYVMQYHRSDPFAPRRFLYSRAPLVTTPDIGGRRGLLSAPYGSELLARFGIEYETALYIRDGDRMLGAIRVARSAEDGDLDDREREFLRRVQLFIERAYSSALKRTRCARGAPRWIRRKHA